MVSVVRDIVYTRGRKSRSKPVLWESSKRHAKKAIRMSRLAHRLLQPPPEIRAFLMMYDAYQGMADIHDRIRLNAESVRAILQAWSSNPFAPPWRRMAAYYELVALAGFTHARPDYGIDSVETRGKIVP